MLFMKKLLFFWLWLLSVFTVKREAGCSRRFSRNKNLNLSFLSVRWWNTLIHRYNIYVNIISTAAFIIKKLTLWSRSWLITVTDQVMSESPPPLRLCNFYTELPWTGCVKEASHSRQLSLCWFLHFNVSVVPEGILTSVCWFSHKAEWGSNVS